MGFAWECKVCFSLRGMLGIGYPERSYGQLFCAALRCYSGALILGDGDLQAKHPFPRTKNFDSVSVLGALEHLMIPFSVALRVGAPVTAQLLYVVDKDVIMALLLPGDKFPSVRVLSQELRMNPNTVHKVIF